MEFPDFNDFFKYLTAGKLKQISEEIDAEERTVMLSPTNDPNLMTKHISMVTSTLLLQAYHTWLEQALQQSQDE